MRVIGTYNKAEEGHLVASILEGHGIEAHVHQEFTGGSEWIFGSSGTSVRVLVADNDYPRAREVLDSPGGEISPSNEPPPVAPN